MKVYQAIARKLAMMANNKLNTQWYDKAENDLFDIEKNHLPSGSGFDNGCTVNLDKSGPEKIVIECHYHCMNDNGYYDGWVYPAIIVTPSLSFGYDIKINWKSYNSKYKAILSDYILDTMQYHLDEEMEKTPAPVNCMGGAVIGYNF